LLDGYPARGGGCAPRSTGEKTNAVCGDKVERGSVGEVIVIYNYQTQFPPDPEELLQVARAQCRQDGYADAAMGSYPTLRQCTAVNTYGGTCARERATDSFSCRGASTN